MKHNSKELTRGLKTVDHIFLGSRKWIVLVEGKCKTYRSTAYSFNLRNHGRGISLSDALWTFELRILYC